MPDRSRVITQTKRDTLVLQIGVWHGANNPTLKNVLLRKSNKGKSWMDLTIMETVGDR
jgi:hypothetical protein